MLFTVEAQNATKDFDEQFLGILIFGGVVVLIITAVYLMRGEFNPSFGRIYALLALAPLAVALAFANVGSEAKTAAFTLLGTIAGYLAGAKPTETTTTTNPGSDTSVEVTSSGI